MRFDFRAVMAYATLLVYCSLYPLAGWQRPAAPLFSFLWASLPDHVSRSDLLTNFLAYIPFGFVLQRYFSRHLGRLVSVFVATSSGTFLSLLMESLQMFLPSRTASNVDLASNAAGTFFGAALVLMISSASLVLPLVHTRCAARLQTLETEVGVPGLVIVGLWAGSQLIPFVPSMDISSIRAGLGPLWHELVIHDRPLEIGKLIATALNVAGLSLLVSMCALHSKRISILFFLFAFSVFSLKPLIVSRQLSLEQLLALVAALPVFTITRFDPSKKAIVAALSLLVAFTIAELEPGSSGAHPFFNWIPFAEHLEDPINGIASILEIFWPSAALAYATSILDGKRRATPVVGGILWGSLVFTLEWMQRLIPGRFGDFTTVLLAIVGWIVGRRLAQRLPLTLLAYPCEHP